MAHRMVCRLLRETMLVLLNQLRDHSKSLLLFLESGFELVSLSELVLHLVFHLSNLLAILFHFLVDTSFKIFDLFQISLSSFDLYLQLGSSALSIVELSLLELEVILHLFHICLRR